MSVTLSAISAFQPSVLGGVSVAGFFTWIILKRRSVRGDFAAIFYSAVFAILFFVAHHSGRTVETPLGFCAALAGIYVSSALLCTVAYRYSPFHPLAGYPGPRLWWISSLRLAYVSFRGRRHFILHDLHAKYGPFMRIGPNTMSINTLSANHIIYGAGTGMEKSESYNTPGHLHAIALFFKQKTKDIHSNRKRIWSAAFTGASVNNFYAPLERRTWQLLKCIEARQTMESGVELSKCFCHWSYDFMGDMVFGGCNNLELMKNGDPRRLVEGGKMATILLDSVGQSPWLMDIIWHLPAGSELQRLRNVAAEMMRTRIKADKDVNTRDLTSYLLEGNLQTGEKIPERDLELDAVVAIQGGSDNTSTTMSLAFYFMLSRPAYYQRLQAEVDNAFPDRTGYLDPTTLMNLPFLNGVITEALRLGSPFFLPRVVPDGGVTIDGNFIPGGTIVAIAAYSQQVSPDNYYPDPMDYRPERWCPGGLGPGSKTEKSALFSFSSGPHVCVAKSFAHQEMRHVVARILLLYDMRLADGFDIPGFRSGILNMRTSVLEKPLMVRVTRRAGVNLDAFL